MKAADQPNTEIQPPSTAASLEEPAALLEAVLDATSDAIIVIGADGGVRAANAAFRKMWAVTEGPGEGVLTVFGVCTALLEQLADPEAARDQIFALLASGTEPGGGEAALRDGQVIHYHWQPRLIDGVPSGGVLRFNDVTNQRRATERLSDAVWVNSALGALRRNLEWSSDVAVMLHRLCRATCETMGSDASHTYLWRREEKDFSLVAGHGDRVEQWQALREMHLDGEALGGLVAAFERDEVIEVAIDHLPEALRENVQQNLGVRSTLLMALRRGDELIGFHTACLRRPAANFQARHLQLARGVAPLVSLAIENALLVQELTRSGRRKVDFLSVISHEIRTPLHVILGWTSLLLDGSILPDTEEFRDVMARIDRSGRQIGEVIDAAADLTHVEGLPGATPVDVAVSLEDIFHDVESETRVEFESSGLAFAWSFERRLPRVRGEREKLRAVLRNLVWNALRFTREGSVTVAARQRAGGVELAVSDTGFGLGPQALGAIFEPFQAIGQPVRGEASGTGLGLHAVHGLVETLGGEIEVESEVGVGSTFRIWLPAVAEPRVATA